jgi:hypothetical protein
MRILTKRDFADFVMTHNDKTITIKNPSVEYLDFENGYVFWRFEDYTEGIMMMFLKESGVITREIDIKDYCCEGCFAVDVDFITEKFREVGRVFDKSKMPEGFIERPYR